MARREKEGELATTFLEFPVAPCRLSCQIPANQRETETSANVNKHWKTRAKGKFANRKTLIRIRLYMELMEKIKNIQTSPFRTLETNCDAQDQEVPVWRRCEVYRKWSYWCPPLKSTPPALCIIDAHMKVAPKCYEIAKAIKIIGFVQFLAWETSLRLVHWLYLDHLVAKYRPVS